ncbi:MaoC family dehydratase [Actinomycetospora straminea]|uniref:MaoC-like domain-containing protein n=1 Tax=Actinomycetospora straminea TaxID=663607 RepID=A0ABP9FB42_9PSEU|nr:MaoC family dehydratase [Actinomycetospora straminea]MDD7936363.1 MaoC family dehydratase [Actinomycetospora straminea]
MTAAPAPAPADLAGLRLPGGTSRVEGYESLLMHDAVRAPRRPEPHPIWAFLAPQRGMGCSLAELFTTLGCPLEAGPLLGRFAARCAAPLALDVDHEVRGGVTTVRRRRGRVLGVVDEVELVLDLRRGPPGAGAPVLTATYVFLLPRPGVTDAPAAGGTPDAVPEGPEHPGAPITVRADEMKLLALLLRDPNPIHLDPDAAAAVGLGHACVNQGPANLAYALTHVTARRPDAVLTGFAARFRATVVAGDVVTPVARDDGSFALRHADGRDAVTGTAELRGRGGP